MFTRRGRLLPSTWRALGVLPLWIACVTWMWGWWLFDVHVATPALFIPLTLALLYEFALLPSIFLYFLFRIKYPDRKIALTGKKVAVISLCVPSSESIDIVERQLQAMAAIKYPHDSWILDEGNSKIIKRLAKQYGVKHFSRKGIKRYNQSEAPFKAKTKAGNVNAWLEHTKRQKYEFFVQFDIDHLAKPNYLHKTLGYFKDEQVAWVQAPSVYGNHQHWTARGSSEQELVLQGPLQMGFYGHSQTPFIIGSHCTYRTSAVRQIGGFQPTRAEDHLDTVMLANLGYKGVFLPEIIAVGDGPETLDTYLGQQFAWAYSMFQVLTQHSPKLLGAMPWNKRFQFLFSQTWYPLWSLSYFITFIVPVISLLIDRDVTHLQSHAFIQHFIPLFACSFLVWWCGRPVMQPAGIGLTWRGMLLHVVRWPIVLLAVLSAAFRVTKPYMITPKGQLLEEAPTISVYRPFLVLGLTSSLSVLIAGQLYGNKMITSQIFFALTNALFMLTICALDINIRLRETATKLFNTSINWAKPVAATAALAVSLSLALVSSPGLSAYTVSAFAPKQSATQQPAVPVLSKQSTAQLTSTLAALPGADCGPEPTVGLYNVNRPTPGTAPYIRHVFIDWRDAHALALQLLQSEQYCNTPLVTLEPRGEHDGQKLLQGIIDGNYDGQLSRLSSVLAASHRPVYIRFAHEMELVGLYPWSDQDPSLYIAAYRHVVDYVRAHGGVQSRWVWSPAGNVGSNDYYPGDDDVDVIGTTILYDKYFYPDFPPNFDDLAGGRSWLQSLGKPVWIAEFGAGKADPLLQTDLLNQALHNYRADGFSAIVYLNSADSNIAGPDYRLANFAAFGSLFDPRLVVGAGMPPVRSSQPRAQLSTNHVVSLQLPAPLRFTAPYAIAK